MIPSNAYQGRLDPTRAALLNRLQSELNSHVGANRERENYYGQRNRLKELGITMPRELRRVELASAWIQTGVDALANRISFSEFVLPGDSVDSWGITDWWADSNLQVESMMATTSTLIHGVSFILTYRGAAALGEPEVATIVLPATKATALPGRTPASGLDAFLGILGVDETGNTSYAIMVDRTSFTSFIKNEVTKQWTIETTPHGMNRVPVEALVYKPRVGKPFGTSRISRSAMRTTDAGIRALARLELSSEFYSLPQRYLSGADESAFLDADGNPLALFDVLTGGIIAQPALYDYDEETERETPKLLPQFGQFPASSPEPIIATYKLFAADVASQFGLPISAFGIEHSNPSSAEAIYAAKENLIIDAEATITIFGAAWARAARTAAQLREGLPTPPRELRGLSAVYADPSTPSRAQAADAAVKLAPVAETGNPVLMRLGGMTASQVEQQLAHLEEHRAQDALGAILSGSDGGGAVANG